MTHVSRMMVGAVILLTLTAVADAQTCMGLASFSSGPVQIGAAGEFGNDAQAFTGNLAVGSTAGPFGGASIGTVSYDELEGNATAIGGQLGWQLPLGTEGRVQLCPIAGVGYTSGPEDIEPSGTDVSTWAAFFGLQLGISTGAPGFRVVPTAGAALAYMKARFEGGLFDFDADETFGILSLGIGMIIDSRVSLLPTVEIPVGLDDSDPGFGIAVAVSFGPRS